MNIDPVPDDLRAAVAKVLREHFPEIPPERIALALPDVRDALERHLGNLSDWS